MKGKEGKGTGKGTGENFDSPRGLTFLIEGPFFDHGKHSLSFDGF